MIFADKLSSERERFILESFRPPTIVADIDAKKFLCFEPTVITFVRMAPRGTPSLSDEGTLGCRIPCVSLPFVVLRRLIISSPLPCLPIATTRSGQRP